MVNLGTIHWSVEVAQAQEAAAEAQEVQESFSDTAAKADQANRSVNQTSGALGKMNDRMGTGQGEVDKMGSALDRFGGKAGLATTALFFLLSKLRELISATSGGSMLTGLLSSIAGLSLGSLLPSISFGAIFSGMTLATALKLLPVIGIGAILGGLVGGELGKLLGHENIGRLLGALSGGALAAYLGTVGIGSVLSGLGIGGGAAGGGALAGLLGSVSLATIVAGVGSVAALIAGLASLGDLVDGDISDWNLPAKFGRALGQGFQEAWPDMAESIHTAFTNNPIYDAGQFTREVATGEEGGAGDLGSNREFSTDLETGYVNVDETPVLNKFADAGRATGNLWDDLTGGASGGRITQGGLMRVHEGETLVPADLDRSAAPEAVEGGGMGGVTIENVNVTLGDQSLDLRDLSRSEMRTLADLLGEQFGEKVQNRVAP